MSSRLPAVWEPHHACWLAWPRLAAEWPGHFEGARDEIAQLARQIATSGGELVRLLVDEADLAQVTARVAPEIEAGRVCLERLPFGDVWTRDTLPFLSVRGDRLVANVFSFDGWGGKYCMAGDAELGSAVATRLGAETHHSALIVEGGALEVNGEGIALTTADSLFARNSHLESAETEASLMEALELERVFTLYGALINDHTDGHIDTLMRFVSPGELVIMWPARGDPNRQTMVQMHAQALYMIEDHELNWTVHQIPSPGVVPSDEGAPLPASYLNFYIANEAVFVPAYGVPSDEPARIALEALFPDRQTYSSPARHLISGGGAIHCVTHQEPALEGSA